jgi:mannose-1-phosphate guanylyltransferase
MSSQSVAVIMAGGAGTRFWPLSTEDRPKQFLALAGGRTLIQMSYDRVVDMLGPERILVLTSARYTNLVAEQLPELPSENIIGEPCRRDTAAAVALAALLVEYRFGDVPMIVLTADHVINPVKEFQRAILEAVENCGDRTLYTLGVNPTYPATQYGYLHMEEELSCGELPHYKLKSFVEKPDIDTARLFLESNNHYWNSGMFVWLTSDILAEFDEHLPGHLHILRTVVHDVTSPEFAKVFETLRPISVDFAILEKAHRIQAVIPEIEWDDLGGWLAVAKYLNEDADANYIQGSVSALDSDRNTVFLEDSQEQLILLGVSKLVVVRSGGRTLVASKDSLDLLKAALSKLE